MSLYEEQTLLVLERSKSANGHMHFFNTISEPTIQEGETSYTWFGMLAVIQKLKGQSLKWWKSGKKRLKKYPKNVVKTKLNKRKHHWRLALHIQSEETAFQYEGQKKIICYKQAVSFSQQVLIQGQRPSYHLCTEVAFEQKQNGKWLVSAVRASISGELQLLKSRICEIGKDSYF